MAMIDKSQFLNRMALNQILTKIQPDAAQPKWVRCPLCKVEWNKLLETGACVDCSEKCHDC